MKQGERGSDAPKAGEIAEKMEREPARRRNNTHGITSPATAAVISRRMAHE